MRGSRATAVEVSNLLPPGQPDPLWSKALQIAQSPVIFPTTEEGIALRARLSQDNWQIVLHWVFKKKWNKKHKIPTSRVTAEGWEPFAEILYRLLELAIQIHAVPGMRTPYVNAAEWFSCIVLEWKTLGLIEAVTLADTKHAGKKSYLSEVRGDLKALRQRENPFQRNLHTGPLIDSAIALVSNSENFCEDYWKPLLTAFAAWGKTLDRNPDAKAIRQKDGSLTLQSGKGRGQKGIKSKILSRSYTP